MARSHQKIKLSVRREMYSRVILLRLYWWHKLALNEQFIRRFVCCKVGCALNHLKTMNNHEKQFQSSKSGFAACSRSYSPFKQWFSHLLVIHWSFIGDFRRHWWINQFQTKKNPKILLGRNLRTTRARKNISNFEKFNNILIFDVYFRDFGVISKNSWFSGSSGIDESRFTCIN